MVVALQVASSKLTPSWIYVELIMRIWALEFNSSYARYEHPTGNALFLTTFSFIQKMIVMLAGCLCKTKQR